MAWHLEKMIATDVEDNNDEVQAFSSRKPEQWPDDADVYIIAVSDNVINEVSSKLKDTLPSKQAIVCHTSGSTPLTAINAGFKNRGVWYPMQTFTAGVAIDDYAAIPIFVEGENTFVQQALLKLANKVSGNVRLLDSEGRKALHLSAVFACNYAGYMLFCADEILKSQNMNLSLLYPLIKETMNKYLTVPPRDAVTGPARRHDTLTLHKHEEYLNDAPEMQELYKIIAQHIMNQYQ